MGRGSAVLALPAGLALIALATGNLAAKMSEPLSCALIVLIARGSGLPRRQPVLWLVVALAFSAAGDWFLSTRGGREDRFLIGIALYFAAHVGFLVFALRQGRLDRRALVILLAVYVPYYALAIAPSLSSNRLSLAVLLYLLISCVTLSAAWGLRVPAMARWFYVAGIGLIVFSDTLISFKEFLAWNRWDGLILPTYYLAHLCVTWSVLVPEKEAAHQLDSTRSVIKAPAEPAP